MRVYVLFRPPEVLFHILDMPVHAHRAFKTACTVLAPSQNAAENMNHENATYTFFTSDTTAATSGKAAVAVNP